MKILMIGPSPDGRGGISTILRSYRDSGFLEKNGIDLLSSNEEGTFLHKCIVFIKALAWLVTHVHRYDILHIHTAMRSSLIRKLIIMALAKIARKKIILHMHDGETERLIESFWHIKKMIILYFINRASAVIVLAHCWREYFVKKLNVDPNKITVVYNSVEFTQKKREIDEFSKIIYVGRVDYNKRLSTLVLALQQVAANFPDVHLYVCGSGEISKVQELVEELEIQDHCSFLGWLKADQLSAIFDQCQILCLPSAHEGMPMSILEAMSHSLLVLATPVGGVPEIIEHKVSGLLFPVDDVNSLADCLYFAMRNPDAAADIASYGYDMAKRRFSLDNHELISRLYKKIFLAMPA